MKVSIVVAVNREGLLERMCASLAKNSATVEIIAVGISSTAHQLCTRYIEIKNPEVNAAQCWAIGAQAATGDLLGLVPDDVIFSDNFIDALVEEASKQHNPFDMFTALFVDGNMESLDKMRISGEDMPLLPVCGFTYTKTYHAVGGLDRRFKRVLWDTDLYMHLCEMGGSTYLLAGHTCREHCSNHTLCQGDGEVGHKDIIQLDVLWPGPRHPLTKRTSPRMPWSKEELEWEERA